MWLEVLEITKKDLMIDFEKLWELVKADLDLEGLTKEEIIDAATTHFGDNCLQYLSDLLGTEFFVSTNSVTKEEDPFNAVGGTPHDEIGDINENLEKGRSNNIIFWGQIDSIVDGFKKYLEEG